MDLPSEKHPASPITGRNLRQGGSDSGPHQEVTPDEDADLTIGDDIFQRPALLIPSRLPPRPPAKEPARDAFTDPALPAAEPRDVEVKKRKKNPLEKRTSAPMQQFKRVLRPQTALTASAATDNAKAESPATMNSVDFPEFGKARGTVASPDFRRNKLHGVLDSAYKHSRMGWLDVVDRIGPRTIITVLVLLTAGAFVAWRFYGAFGGDAVTTQAEQEAKGLPAAERIARGKAAVQALIAAQTVAARLPLVMDPERAAPRMREFYETMKGQNPQITAWEVGAPVGSANGDWLPLIFTDAAGRKVTVSMGETEKGCIIDWENFTAFGDMPWADFCRTRPIIPKSLRIRMRRVEKYDPACPKESWQSYEIEHRSGGPRLIAYASRAGRYAQTLAELVKGESWQCALLYLRWAGTGSQAFPVIEDIVRTRWQDEATSWTGP